MAPDARREHVLALTDELKAMTVVDFELVCGAIGCTEDEPAGYAFPRQRPFPGAPLMPRLIVLSHDPGDSAEAYLVALHELGHLAIGHKGRTLEREAAAWRWALSQTREEPGPHEWLHLYLALGSYKACARCKTSSEYDALLTEARRKSRV